MATLVAAATLQPLLGQSAKPQAGSPGLYEAQKFELARASGFDFSKLSGSNRNSISPQVVWRKMPENPSALSSRDKDSCYTLHVYQFSHEDDEPARMTGSTTCTPANRFGLKAAIMTQSTAR
jgi:hypothetical protein